MNTDLVTQTEVETTGQEKMNSRQIEVLRGEFLTPYSGGSLRNSPLRKSYMMTSVQEQKRTTSLSFQKNTGTNDDWKRGGTKIAEERMKTEDIMIEGTRIEENLKNEERKTRTTDKKVRTTGRNCWKDSRTWILRTIMTIAPIKDITNRRLLTLALPSLIFHAFIISTSVKSG